MSKDDEAEFLGKTLEHLRHVWNAPFFSKKFSLVLWSILISKVLEDNEAESLWQILQFLCQICGLLEMAYKCASFWWGIAKSEVLENDDEAEFFGKIQELLCQVCGLLEMADKWVLFKDFSVIFCWFPFMLS